MSRRIVLFAHGSADPRWRAPFEALLRRLRTEMGEGAVDLAYMEFAAPTLQDVAERARREGVSTLRLLPLFLAAGGHVARDIPVQAEEVRRRHGLQVEILPPVGEDPRFAALVEAIAREATEP